jgi:hypothetical protein
MKPKKVIDLRDRLAPYDDAHLIDLRDPLLTVEASDPDTNEWAAEVRHAIELEAQT